MLSENIKAMRESKGLSQEELAIKLNVVRQTVSKWERGLSVPDADLLIALSKELDTTVNVLLGESLDKAGDEPSVDDIKKLAEKLEVVNLQLARQKEMRRKVLHGICIAVCALVIVIFASLVMLGSSYLTWDFTDPEIAVVGTLYHAFEWVFVRISPFILIASIVGICLTKKRDS